MTKTPLSVRNLSVAYHNKVALDNVSFDTQPGTLTGIVGPNGAGKSTLLKACLGMAGKLSGEALFFGRPLSKVRGRVAYVPQRSSVDWDFPASALDVVTMGLYGRIGWLRPVRRRHREAALSCLDQVGMADYAARQIGQLSGGQQQRVFVARALASQADLYLMDEPFAGVDAATEQAILELMQTLRDQGKSMIIVHHDLQSVRDFFEQILLLNVDLIAAGPVKKVFTEKNLQRAYGGKLLFRL